MQPKNRQTTAILNDVKTAMRMAFDDSTLTEEDLADGAQVAQPTINRWFSYKLEYFPPIYTLALWPELIVVPLCKFFVKRFGKKIVDEEFNLPTDGRVEDNLLKIDVIQADIIRRMDSNPREALKFVDDLIREAMIAKKELESKI